MPHVSKDKGHVEVTLLNVVVVVAVVCSPLRTMYNMHSLCLIGSALFIKCMRSKLTFAAVNYVMHPVIK